MANICSCDVTVTGPKDQLATFWKDMKAQDLKIIEKCIWFEKFNGAYCAMIDEASVSEDSIFFQMATKWDPKVHEIANVSIIYPELTFEVSYEESGNMIFGKAFICDGVVDDHGYTPHEFYYDNNEDYAEVYNLLTDPETPWKDCKDLLDDEDFECTPYYDIEHLLAARIPVEALAPYADHNWYSDEAKDVFEERSFVASTHVEDLPFHVSREWKSEVAAKEYRARLASLEGTCGQKRAEGSQA